MAADERQRDMPGTKERRSQSSDWVARIATLLSVLSWAVMFIAWYLWDQARPPYRTAITTMARSAVGSGHWNDRLLSFAFRLLVGSMLISIMSLIFNVTRQKRKTDKYSKFTIASIAITFIGVIFFIVNGVSFL